MHTSARLNPLVASTVLVSLLAGGACASSAKPVVNTPQQHGASGSSEVESNPPPASAETTGEQSPAETSVPAAHGPGSIAVSAEDRAGIEDAARKFADTLRSKDAKKIRAALIASNNPERRAQIEAAPSADMIASADFTGGMYETLADMLAGKNDQGVVSFREGKPETVCVFVMDAGETDPNVGTSFYFTKIDKQWEVTHR